MQRTEQSAVLTALRITVVLAAWLALSCGLVCAEETAQVAVYRIRESFLPVAHGDACLEIDWDSLAARAESAGGQQWLQTLVHVSGRKYQIQPNVYLYFEMQEMPAGPREMVFGQRTGVYHSVLLIGERARTPSLRHCLIELRGSHSVPDYHELEPTGADLR